MFNLRDKKSLSVHGVFLAALMVACTVSLVVGAVPLPADGLWRSGIFRLRLARTALGVIAGGGLSAAGVIFQAILRNPLAEPYVLGVSSGAGLGAALAIVTGVSRGSLDTPRLGFCRGAGHDPARLCSGLYVHRNGAFADAPLVGRGGRRRAGKSPHVRGVDCPFGAPAWRSLVAPREPPSL